MTLVTQLSHFKEAIMPRTAKYSSKSDFIRQFLALNPEATNEEIINAGRRAKQDITKASIGYVRYGSAFRQRLRLVLSGSETIAPLSIPAPTSTDNSFDISAVRENPFADLTKTKAWKSIQKEADTVRKFCDRHGGIEAVKTIIENLENYEQLQKLLN